MLLTKKGIDNLLKSIMETGGLSDDMENSIKRIQDDFDEREGILKNYGEEYDGELDEYDFKEKTIVDEGGYEEKYKTMKQKYIDRFFGTADVEEKVDDIMKETEEDVERDGTEQTFDDLFEKREG